MPTIIDNRKLAIIVATDLTVATLLGTVVIRRARPFSLSSQNWRLTKHNTTHDGLTFHHHFQFKSVLTL